MGYGTPIERFVFVTRRLEYMHTPNANDAFLPGLNAGVSR